LHFFAEVASGCNPTCASLIAGIIRMCN
jgi:hypothetical protein